MKRDIVCNLRLTGGDDRGGVGIRRRGLMFRFRKGLRSWLRGRFRSKLRLHLGGGPLLRVPSIYVQRSRARCIWWHRSIWNIGAVEDPLGER